MKCDIIIPVWNQLELTRECIKSIIRKTHYPYRLVIIDNGSDARTHAYLESLKETEGVHLIRNEDNIGFVKAVNQALKVSDSPFICIMNNDTVATDGWLREMVDVANLKEEIGLVNPSSNNLGQHKESSTIDDYAAKLKRSKGEYIEMGACIGFCMLFKRELFNKLGYLDEIYKEGNFDDTDYSRKAEKEGYLCVRAKGTYVYHNMKSSFAKVKNYEQSFKRNQEVFNRRWGRPKRLLYIVTKSHGKLFDWMRDDIYKKARGGNWVWLFFKGHNEKPQMPEHSNMKLFYLSPLFFELNCITRILKKKKPFDSVYVDDPGLIRKIKRFDKSHKHETILMGG
ncbi:MAG: glycosyltransferase [Candidatus Omnitrophica bacterium]|nr:glycosyltransferase [Candidatus Omnitrophota bacterium]